MGLSDTYVRPLRWWRDGWFAWQLARDPTVWQQGLVAKRPTLWSHVKWLWRWRGPPTAAAPIRGWHRERGAWVIGHPGFKRKLGVLRLSLAPELGGVEVHIALSRWARGLGLGSHVLATVAHSVELNTGEPLVARIRHDNVPSIVAFEKAGFLQSAPFGEYLDDPEWVTMEYQPQRESTYRAEIILSSNGGEPNAIVTIIEYKEESDG